jgi:Domain of unknown function (DUF4331)
MTATHVERSATERRRWAARCTAIVAALGMAALFLGPVPGRASSHREAPLISTDPQADNTDVWAFVSPDAPDKVTLIASWYPFEEPGGGPNFYPWATRTYHDIKIDNDGDAKADVVYRWIFKNHRRNRDTFLYNTGQVTSLRDKDLNFYQTYRLERIKMGRRTHTKTLVKNAVAVPSYVGQASMPNYANLFNAGTRSFAKDRARTWTGQSDDPFFLDLRVFDLLYGADFSEVGDDTLAGFNVNTVALQVPRKAVARNHRATKHPIIGMWSTTSRKSTRVLRDTGGKRERGRYVQISRLGAPLVNEVVIPVGEKDHFNASKPAKDGQFLEFVNKPELPKLINAIYGLDVPDSNPDKPGVQRDDLIQVFLTGVPGLNHPKGVAPSEQLRLNMSIPPCEQGNCADYSRLGVIGGDVAGYPNGRRLRDDVIDISLQVVEGELIGSPNDLSDGVNGNDVAFRSSFPYVALPHSGSNPDPH